MKKIVLATALLLGSLQADNIVHYDTKEAKTSSISKPNYPNNDIHTK
ncbi:hypothetical protein [Sulfurimonas lithotrophica]|nr:hypothetical protein [Sulfurimonas lithotrophica]